MAQSGENSPAAPAERRTSSLSQRLSFDSDSAFHATPIALLPATSPVGDALPVKTDVTFMQNQASILRSPSSVKQQASALSRQLSAASHETADQLAIPSALVSIIQGKDSDGALERNSSVSSTNETTNGCNLSKSSSERSNRSIRSTRSVRGIGTYEIGTLRVHSQSPTRDPNQEKHQCLHTGDILVVRDIPVGCNFGYDTTSFEVKEAGQFEGVKDLPPGAHFFWCGSTATSLRTGCWIMSPKKTASEYGDVYVKRWDKYKEALEEELSAAEARIQRQTVPEFEHQLRSYNVAASGSGANQTQILTRYPTIWHDLTSSMKGSFLTQITDGKWNQWQVSSTDDVRDAKPTVTGRTEEDGFGDEVLTFIFPKDSRTFSRESSGRDRTEQAMDTSAHVAAVMSNCIYEDRDQIIGELQFCYVTGMTLGNVACMEQWAHIVKIVFRAFRLALDAPEFFCKFIQAVHSQLIYDHNGFNSSILDHDAELSEELKMTLTVFKARLDELLLAGGAKITEQQSTVGKAFIALESWLWGWNWDLRRDYVRSGKIQLEDGEIIDAELKEFEAEDERGEYAPVVVEVDDDGRSSKKSAQRPRKNSRTAVKWKF